MRTNFIKKLHFSFLSSILLLFITSIVSYLTIKQYEQAASWVNHTNVVMVKLETLLSKMKDAETGTRGYLLTNNELFLQPYHGSQKKVLDLLADIKRLTRDNKAQQDYVPLLQNIISQRYQLQARLINIKRAGDPIPAPLLLEGKKITDEMRAHIKTMQDREQDLLSKRTRVLRSYSPIIPFLIIFIAILSSIITYLFCRRLKISYYRKIKLQKELEQHKIVTNQRIAIIEKLADNIAGGDYHIRVEHSEKDSLGGLAFSLNKMAISLDYSFRALQEMMQKKDDFIGIAAHELKTPLTSIKASLQFISRARLESEEGRRIYPFVTKANNQTNRLTEIVKDLLNVANINAGKLALTTTSFSVREAILECLDEINTATKTHEVVIEGNPDIVINADKFRIEQVLINLISNAMKYSPSQNKIILTVLSIEDYVRIEVTDFGIGIPQDKVSFVFERYFRVEPDSKNYFGMGLGLFISSGIVKRHGGEIGVRSKEGEGSTFWFTLPIAAN